jgi:four helix bundle protein
MRTVQYDFERLEVYQRAMDFAEDVFKVTEDFPQRVQDSLGDQLRRATLSICNNIAEGSRKRGLAKQQFYGYSLDSARECVPMLELSRRRKLIDGAVHGSLDDSCFRIASMMSALIRSVR